jgi:hypothetical protein
LSELQRDVLALHRRQAPAFEAGNVVARTHGGRAAPWRYAERAADIADELRPCVPNVSAADETTLGLLAMQLARLEAMDMWLETNGVFDSRSRVRPVVRLMLQTENSAAKLADSLGLNPRSRASLGLDIASTREALAEYVRDRYGATGEDDAP